MTGWQWFVFLFIMGSWAVASYLMWRSNWENDEDWR